MNPYTCKRYTVLAVYDPETLYLRLVVPLAGAMLLIFVLGELGIFRKR